MGFLKVGRSGGGGGGTTQQLAATISGTSSATRSISGTFKDNAGVGIVGAVLNIWDAAGNLVNQAITTTGGAFSCNVTVDGGDTLYIGFKTAIIGAAVAPADTNVIDDIRKLAQYGEQSQYSVFSEDVADGTHTGTWPTVGPNGKTITASGSPVKQVGGGMRYVKGTAAKHTYPNDQTAPQTIRWGWLVVKADLAANSGAGEIPVWNVHGVGASPAQRQPYYFMNATTGQLGIGYYDSTYRGQSLACRTDLSAWSWMVWWRRGNLIQICVNGVFSSGNAPILSPLYNNGSPTSMIGVFSGNNLVNLEVKGGGMFADEITDACADKVISYVARYADDLATIQALGLPHSGATPPVYKENEAHSRHIHDASVMTALQSSGTRGDTAGSTSEARFKNRGKTAIPKGVKRAFFCDFLSASDVQHNTTGAWDAPFFAPYWINDANANVNSPSGLGASMAAFPGTGYTQTGSEYRINLYWSGSAWFAGAIGTTREDGTGRFFRPPFSISWRFKFYDTGVAGIAAVPDAHFPAVWGYNIRERKLGTRKRSVNEFDWIESDGIDTSYINLTYHTHNADNPGTFTTTHVQGGDTFEKMAGFPMKPANGLWPTTINFYDGNAHDMRLDVDDDYMYLIFDGLEIAREKNIRGLFNKPWDIIINYAMKNIASPTVPMNTAKTYSFGIDYVAVDYPYDKFYDVPASGFTDRPAIVGTPQVGLPLVINTNGLGRQVNTRLYFADGSVCSLPTERSHPKVTRFAPPDSLAGTSIFAECIAVGIKDYPEARSFTIGPIATRVGTNRLSDNFNNTNGTDILSHVSATDIVQSVNAWSVASYNLQPTTRPKIYNNRVRQTDPCILLASFLDLPPSKDYEVEAQATCISEVAADTQGIIGWANNGSTEDYIFLRYSRAGGSWQGGKVIGGTATFQTGSYADTFLAGQVRTPKIKRVGNAITFWMDGVQILTSAFTVADAATDKVGVVGLRLLTPAGNVTDTTCIHWDNLVVRT